MTVARGKYAARAANARAESVSERADRLEAQLADERSASAREIAALKTEVNRLAGQLTTAVKDMAAAEVERIQREAAETLAAAKADWRSRAEAVMEELGSDPANNRMQTPTWANISALLEVPLGHGSGNSRTGRRGSIKRAVAVGTEAEHVTRQQIRADSTRRQFSPLSIPEAREEIAHREEELTRMKAIVDEWEAEFGSGAVFSENPVNGVRL
jgi:hypothetical protein